MSGALWILSYAVLWLGVLSALAVALVSARNYGRVAPEIGTSLAQERAPQIPTGLPSGSTIAGLAIVSTTGEILQPSEWDTAIVIQTSLVGQDESLDTFNDLAAVIPSDFHRQTIVTSVSRPELLADVVSRVQLIHVAHDAAHELEKALGSNIKPHVTLLRGGTVEAARPFTSVADLAEFIDLTLRNEGGRAFAPPPSRTRKVSQ